MQTESQTKPSPLKYGVQIGVLGGIFAAGLFLSSGTLNWPMGWCYLGLVAASQAIVAVVLVSKNPELADERTQTGGKRDSDRVLAGVMALYGPLAICIVAGLNHRHEWQPQVAPILKLAGFAIAIAGTLITLWSIATNRFFYSVMRIVKDHRVCSSGPYGFIRHPGYLGALLFHGASAPMLGSIWALIPAVATAAAIVARTLMEDQNLHRQLDGYSSYARRVRGRLIPGLR